jgi:tetratricopeptide (TPR) repeat protein/predicted amidohydrolase
LTKAISKQLSQLRKIMQKGEYHKALRLAEDLIQQARKDDRAIILLEALLLKAESSWRTGKHDEGQRMLDEAKTILTHIDREKEGDTRKIQESKANLLNQSGILAWYRGNLDNALKYYEESLGITSELQDRLSMAKTYNNLGLVYWSKGDLTQAIRSYLQSLEIHEELKNEREIATVLSNLGNVTVRVGNLDEALRYQERSLVIREKLGIKSDLVLTLINIGVVYQLMGVLDHALDYYQRGLTLAQELNNSRDIALALNNLGNIYQIKGDLDQALDYFQQSLALYQKLGIKEDIALALANIGEIHRKKGNSEAAQEHYQKSLTLYSELENDPLAAVILLELVWVSLDSEDSALSEKSLAQLKQINDRNENRVIDQRYRLAQALVLKSSHRARNRMKAGTILQGLVEEPIADHSLTVTAMIHLSDLLLSELKMTGEEELFEDIKSLTQQLLDIAKEQASPSLLAETYLLQSKLAMIELDMGRAQKLLTQAIQLTIEKGLDSIASNLKKEQNLLQSQVEKWERLVQQNPSRQEMIDQTKIDDLLNKMIQETVTDLMEQQGLSRAAIKKPYQIEYLDFLKDTAKTVKPQFRVGIAQIGLSEKNDILHEYYQEQSPGIFRLRGDKIQVVLTTFRKMVELAKAKRVNILILPELTVDLNFSELHDEVLTLAKKNDIYLIPGSYHNPKTQQNLSVVVSPEGILWEQTKHIPASILFKGERITEGIIPGPKYRTIIVGNTEYGRIAIILCRDFLDMDLRVELKNFEPPIDLIINPAFTPVTSDFQAAHFDARRSLYAYCFFANVAEFGNSLIYTPEKDRTQRTIPPKTEDLIFKDIDLFQLRSERKKWDLEQKKKHSFIQSTR